MKFVNYNSQQLAQSRSWQRQFVSQKSHDRHRKSRSSIRAALLTVAIEKEVSRALESSSLEITSPRTDTAGRVHVKDKHMA